MSWTLYCIARNSESIRYFLRFLAIPDNELILILWYMCIPLKRTIWKYRKATVIKKWTVERDFVEIAESNFMRWYWVILECLRVDTTMYTCPRNQNIFHHIFLISSNTAAIWPSSFYKTGCIAIQYTYIR